MVNEKQIDFEQYLYALTINSMENAEDTKRVLSILRKIKSLQQDEDSEEELKRAKMALANKLMFINMMSRRLTGCKGFIAWDMAKEDPDTGERFITDEAKLELADTFLKAQK